MTDEEEGGCCESLCRKSRMDSILKALGFDSKRDYAEKIPETLTPEHFNLHETFHHGFPSQPTCLAYDSVQQLLAIGTETGAVLLLGKPGLERYFCHPVEVPILQMTFITNKGRLVTSCDNKTLYLWSLEGKSPRVVHRLEFSAEKPTVISWNFDSEWMYVGTDNGNVHIVHVENFIISGYCVHWNNAIDPHQRDKPGDVIGVSEHPMDQSKLMIAYISGLCVLWNLKSKSADRRFAYYPPNNHIMTSMCWYGNGKGFACSYSDGSIAYWSCKVESKPDKIIVPHECDTAVFKPIYKLQLVYTDSDSWYICSGGFPEHTTSAPLTLTIYHNKSYSLLTTSSTILDFLCLPSSPFPYDLQKPFALVILAKNELIVHDLQTLGYPSFNLPYALDVHLPPVTCVQYCGNCPEEFIASLHSVKSKQMAEHKSTKPWPLMGGKWGEEVPQMSTDLIITGHTDGSVRLWFCSSVIFQPFFTVSTARYFKMKHKASPIQSKGVDTPVSAKSSPPTSAKGSTPMSAKGPPRPPPPKLQDSKINFAPVRIAPRIDLPMSPLVEEEPSAEGGEEKEKPDERERDTPSPATGQLQQQPSLDSVDGEHSVTESTDFTVSGSIDGSPATERRVVRSREKRSMFRKKPRATAPVESSRTSSPPVKEDSNLLSPEKEPKENKPSTSKKMSKSFRKVARFVKTGQKLSGQSSKRDSTEATDSASTDTPSAEDKESPTEHPTAPQEPRDGPSPETPGICFSTQQHRPETLTCGVVDETKPKSKPSDTSAPGFKFPPEVAPHLDEALAIQEINVCVHGLWMCIANMGGNVFAFQFKMAEVATTSKSLDICFNHDSVLKPGASGVWSSPPSSTTSPLQMPTGWVFQEGLQDSLPGFYLAQHCRCFHCNNSNPEQAIVPVTVSSMQYSKSIGMLAIGTDQGLALVDTLTNRCLYTLSNLTSILYLADNSKYIRQMRRETSQLAINPSSPKPTIMRHATSWALSMKAMETDNGQQQPARSKSTPELPKVMTPGLTVGSSLKEGAQNGDSLMSLRKVEECECSVTALEIVQLQMDKQSPPSLTLWVGLASGHVAAYGIVIRQPGTALADREIDLIPTRFIMEQKCIVSLHFLNEWGDLQVVPYKVKSPEGVRRINRLPDASQSQKPLHYMIVTDVDKIRSFSFPGCVQVSKGTPLPDGSSWLRSEYFKCNDLPCLLSLTTCCYIVVHCLPGLTSLLKLPYPLLRDSRVLCTFRVSGNGRVLYMSSGSEIQRLSIVTDDRMNLPMCLPDMYVSTKVPPSSGGKGKTIGTLFGSNPSEVDREDLFGRNAGRPWVSLARRDGKAGSGMTYPTRRERQQKAAGEVGGVGGKMKDNIEALSKRGEDLSELEKRTFLMKDHASEYASNAEKLRRKLEGKSRRS